MSQWQERAEISLAGVKKQFMVPMSELTTFKIGGPLDLLVEPFNIEQLQLVLNFCATEDLSWQVIGRGSNLLVREKGVRGLGILLSGDFAVWKVDDRKVKAGAGMALADLAKQTANLGLTGLEFACGIPGTVGGAVYMNAGAYDGEMAGVLTKVQSYDPEFGLRNYEKNDLKMGYRFSCFQECHQIITEVELNLEKSDKVSTEAKIAELTCQRASKQPLEMPSAGSVFRRPVGFFVGPMIEQAGLKGYTIGNAQVSLKHAGFIVNTGGATCSEVLALIKHIQEVISRKFGVDLITEIKIIGEE